MRRVRSFGYALTTTADPGRVLAYLADLRNLEDWVREIREVRVDGSDVRVLTRRGIGPDLELRYVVETDETAGTVLARGEHPSMRVVDRWTVRPSGGGSAVEYVGEYELRGLSRLVGPLAQLFGQARARELGRALNRRLDRLG